ncbi:unnamed protein product [Rhizophagus irregularis]|nr:unnamed protein product [Rhizophagus irregularis]
MIDLPNMNMSQPKSDYASTRSASYVIIQYKKLNDPFIICRLMQFSLMKNIFLYVIIPKFTYKNILPSASNRFIKRADRLP